MGGHERREREKERERERERDTHPLRHCVILSNGYIGRRERDRETERETYPSTQTLCYSVEADGNEMLHEEASYLAHQVHDCSRHKAVYVSQEKLLAEVVAVGNPRSKSDHNLQWSACGEG